MSSKVASKNKFKSKKKVKIFTKKKGEPESVLIQKLQQKYNEIDTSKISVFKDLPLSSYTLKGLKECGYVKPTEIQRDTIGLSLQGKDILGAAQTGSGKTLAFIIPILEKLFCKQWTRLDGVGALVITPTRELAYQIFETLRKVGVHHQFSAGLIIGGKDLKFERSRMDQCNIVICTPGRLLQHMDENPLFDCVNMQILVLDEADRCLDMGFEQTMNAIIANLPAVRQTLLFSATQTKSVKDLARLSLKDPSYVSVHEHAKHSTPPGLQQSYVICELQDKISIIWSFIKNHLKKKCIIFFSSCKQVKYIYEIFCKLRPGMSLLALYGSLHQLKRMEIYETFCHKQAAVLFATDLAARGLDFPAVDWVVQADCPEDGATYIHRVGRTARYNRGGESLLLLLPSEEAILSDLTDRKIPIEKIDINPKQLHNPVKKMQVLLSTSVFKESAQRAFIAYVKSVFLMKNKNVFKVNELDTDAFSESLGLPKPPRLRFLQRLNKKTNQKNESKELGSQSINQNSQNKIFRFSDSDDSGVSEDESENHTVNVKFQAIRKNHNVELPAEQDIMQLDFTEPAKKKPITKAALVKQIMKKKILPNKKIIFDDADETDVKTSEEQEIIVEASKERQEPVVQETNENQSEPDLDCENLDLGLERFTMMLRKQDKHDKTFFKEKEKVKKKEKKKKLKKKKLADEEDDFGTDSEFEEPDLSWLPDPDKVYGEKDEENDENSKDDDIDSDDEKEQDINDNTFFMEEKVKKKKKKMVMEKKAADKDDFGTDSDEPDLSRLHDGENSEESDENIVDDEEDSMITMKKTKYKKPKKRKPSKTAEKPARKKKKLEDLAESLSVNDAEELALLLLSKNK